MPFQFSEGNQQYHPPVAPELPGRVNIPQGDFVGNSIVNAFVHRAIASEQAQLQQQQMMQQADLQAQHLAYQDKWQTQDYEIAKQNADSLSSYREKEADWHLANKTARDDALKAKQDKEQAAKDLVTNFTTAANRTDSQSIPDAQPLIDPEAVRTRPGDVLRGMGDWKTKWGGAKVGATPAVEKQLDKIAADMQVPVVLGANYVDSKGNETVVDKNDPLAWRVPAGQDKATGEVTWRGVQPSDIQQRQLSAVASEYSDPISQRKVANQLIAAGHGTVEKTEETSGFDIWHPIATAKAKTGQFRKSTTVTQTPTLDKWANRLLLDLGSKRAAQQSHVPPALKYTPKQWMIKSGGGIYDTGTADTTAGTGDEEATLQAQARMAVQLDPSAKEKVRAIYQQQMGEDADTSFLDE